MPQQLVDAFFASISYYPPSPAIDYDGNVHVWSLSAEPQFQYFQRDQFGAYVLGGVGLYRKRTKMGENAHCDKVPCYGEPYPGPRDFKRNALGGDIGLGFAWRPALDSPTKFFIETRYVQVKGKKPLSTLYTLQDKPTGYFPITAGISW